MDAGRESSPFYDRTHRLTLNRIRDDPGSPTLTSFMYIDQRGLTIEDCVATCIGAKASIAGLEQGTDCCK